LFEYMTGGKYKVSFDAGFSRSKDGKTDHLKYYWDFGDGTPLVSTTEPTIQHTFPTQAAWRDVKLLVQDGAKFASFRQEEPIDFFPTYYPAVAPASEPLPPATGPQADPCGKLAPAEEAALIVQAKTKAKPSKEKTPSLAEIASTALTVSTPVNPSPTLREGAIDQP
jgi:hypothetical protein